MPPSQGLPEQVFRLLRHAGKQLLSALFPGAKGPPRIRLDWGAPEAWQRAQNRAHRLRQPGTLREGQAGKQLPDVAAQGCGRPRCAERLLSQATKTVAPCPVLTGHHTKQLASQAGKMLAADGTARQNAPYRGWQRVPRAMCACAGHRASGRHGVGETTSGAGCASPRLQRPEGLTGHGPCRYRRYGRGTKSWAEEAAPRPQACRRSWCRARSQAGRPRPRP